jgi:hypothetical protein
LAGTLEDLLVVKPDENSSGMQAIKVNPSKPSVDAISQSDRTFTSSSFFCRSHSKF